MLSFFVAVLCVTTQNLDAYDLTVFEQSVLPAWLKQFQLTDTSGHPINQFSFSPNTNVAGVYGSADVLHILYTVGQLNLTESLRQKWVQHVNSFQNDTGFFRLGKHEKGGWEPWHVTGDATAALRLIDGYPARPNTLYESIARNQSLWEETFEPLIKVKPGVGCKDFHQCAHKIVAIPVMLALTSANSSAEFEPFLTWLINYLDSNLDHSTGTWCTKKEKDEGRKGLLSCLGGSFAVHVLHTGLNKTWPDNQTVQNFSLNLQENGLWAGWKNYLNIDGLFQATRIIPTSSERTIEKVKKACETYLSVAVPKLNDKKEVIKDLSENTHGLFAPVAAVSECNKWFPGMIKTVRPWKSSIDKAPFL